jgi:hypothetical protein
VRSTDPTRENPNGETRVEVGGKMNLDKSAPASTPSVATPSAPAREHHAAPEPHEGGGYAGPDHPDHSNTT